MSLNQNKVPDNLTTSVPSTGIQKGKDLSSEGRSPEIGHHRWRLARQIGGYLIAILCLIWVFYDIHPEKMLIQVSEIRWGWISLAILFDIFSYFSQGLRWKLLLHPIGHISPVRTTQAVYAGLFTNEIVPFRAGELVRMYLVSRWMSVKFVSIFPSLVVERLFDGIWLGIGIGIIALFLHLPPDLLHAADILGLTVIAATLLFVFLVIRKKKNLDTSQDNSGRVKSPLRFLGGILSSTAQGIRQIGTSKYLYLSLLISALIFIGQIVAFWLVMISYGLALSLWDGAAVLLIVHFGTTIPNAPSNIGTYQFFCVLGLSLFGIDKTTASGFSMVVFIILTIPLWIIGLLAIQRSGMKLKNIRREISELLKRKKTTLQTE